MTQGGKKISRRHFLFKSACFFSGSLAGLNLFSNALAAQCGHQALQSIPRIALIIDDIGFSKERLMQFLEIDMPLSFAILPRLPKTLPLAETIHDFHHEVLLHQPMEPYDSSIDPGPGALYVDYHTDRIVETIGQNIRDIPYVTGVNNHMGSRFTSSRDKMSETLEVIKEKDLFFIDSLTTSSSKAYKTARKLHVASACRNIFLDNLREEKAITRQLSRLSQLAKKRGHAIGIGHPFPETASAIGRFMENTGARDFSFVHISKLIPC